MQELSKSSVPFHQGTCKVYYSSRSVCQRYKTAQAPSGCLWGCCTSIVLLVSVNTSSKCTKIYGTKIVFSSPVYKLYLAALLILICFCFLWECTPSWCLAISNPVCCCIAYIGHVILLMLWFSEYKWSVLVLLSYISGIFIWCLTYFKIWCQIKIFLILFL